MSKQNKMEGGVLSERMDVGSESFNELQAFLWNKSNKRSQEQKVHIELMALTFKMEDYLRADDSSSRKVGDFLMDYLAALEIKQNRFALYLGLKASNLNKLIKGERPLNHELALIFGKIFRNDPMLWLEVQDKNKLYQVRKEKSEELDKYSLDDLIKRS